MPTSASKTFCFYKFPVSVHVGKVGIELCMGCTECLKKMYCKNVSRVRSTCAENLIGTQAIKYPFRPQKHLHFELCSDSDYTFSLFSIIQILTPVRVCGRV